MPMIPLNPQDSPGFIRLCEELETVIAEEYDLSVDPTAMSDEGSRYWHDAKAALVLALNNAYGSMASS